MTEELTGILSVARDRKEEDGQALRFPKALSCLLSPRFRHRRLWRPAWGLALDSSMFAIRLTACPKNR
jgi:hypothetical protein